MRRLISMLALLFTLTFTSNAMSYEQAREQALFLTDKMAYELNLTDDQYEAAYEINLDYLMSINSVDDLYGSYWRYRNLDMSYVLLDWQYRAFCDAAYFYRPLYFSGGYWRFGVYARYPHRDYFYFNRPTVYISYCGGHSWHNNHGRSWYDGRHYGPRPGKQHFGMRDGFNRGDYGRGNRQSFGNRTQSTQPQRDNNNRGAFGSRNNINNNRNNALPNNRQNGSFGSRESSTRTTVNQSVRHNLIYSKPRELKVEGKSPRSTFTPSQQRPAQPSQSTGSNRGSFGGGSRSSFGGGNRSSYDGGSRSSFGGGSRGSFGGGSRSVQSSPSRGNSGSSKGSGGSFGSRR